MKSEPLTTTTLLQLLTAADMSLSIRSQVEEHHRDQEPVQLERQPDFTYLLAFANGEAVSLSYVEGEALSRTLLA